MIILIEKECIIMERFKRFLSEMLDYNVDTIKAYGSVFKILKVLMVVLMTESIILVTLLLLYYLYSLG